ncbi:Golgi-associated plant pathogenesis-related protein 1-like [Lineus longissimus]|uniref:Golgi-associated plant pathogenesis-related protein 1-like n=1 Tax=Lineus longissimus TaxID=88925 RepID=UPI002B4E823F
MADKTFIDDVLAAHNHYRRLHQAPPVTVNPKLNKFAQDWADYLAKTDSFAHSKCDLNGTRLGENIAMKMASNAQDYKGKEFVDQWYSEVERYDFKKHGGPSTGHFTQVVWKGSKEIGVGRAVLKGGQKVIVVGSYSPAGNMMGDNDKNVFLTKDGKITLPAKSGPPKGALQPGSAGACRPVSPGRAGGLLARQQPAGAPGSSSVKTETSSKRLPDGRTETVVKETVTKPDGSTAVSTRKTVR